MWASIRHPRRIAVAGLASAIGLSLLCAGLRVPASLAFWDHLAGRALSAEEARALEACDEDPAWRTTLRVVEQDLPVPCGDAWLVERVAPTVGGTRARWLADRVTDPSASPLRRVRAALVLALAGEPSPVEAAFLLPTVPPEARAAWAEAARVPAVGVQLGPAGMALGVARSLADGDAPADDAAIGALEFLAATDDPVAAAAVVAVATRTLDADPELLTRAAERQGPVSGVPPGWLPVLRAHRGCPAPCAGAWLALVERHWTQEALDRGAALPADFALDDDLDELLALSGASVAEHRALGWGVAALADWVAAAADPKDRLHALARAAVGPPDPLGAVRDGRTSPFVGALVARAVARRTGHDVAVRARPGEVWLRVGRQWAVRGCGPPPAEAEPPAEDWPPDAVRAAALAERATAQADPARALRLATAAASWDALVAGPLVERLRAGAVPEGEPGRRVGHALLRPSEVPVGAEDDRRSVGAAPLGCP